MKALELRTFPRPVRPRFSYGGNPYGDQIQRERALIESKRLTAAELAAEYWRAGQDEAYIVEGVIWKGMCDGWSTSESDALRRSCIITRFATLPHYDQEDQP